MTVLQEILAALVAAEIESHINTGMVKPRMQEEDHQVLHQLQVEVDHEALAAVQNEGGEMITIAKDVVHFNDMHQLVEDDAIPRLGHQCPIGNV